jgi:hypothetical protein
MESSSPPWRAARGTVSQKEARMLGDKNAIATIAVSSVVMTAYATLAFAHAYVP